IYIPWRGSYELTQARPIISVSAPNISAATVSAFVAGGVPLPSSSCSLGIFVLCLRRYDIIPGVQSQNKPRRSFRFSSYLLNLLQKLISSFHEYHIFFSMVEIGFCCDGGTIWVGFVVGIETDMVFVWLVENYVFSA
ncbi:MAG: hypothetical protein ABJJ39_03160, partial [Kangiellaceae bacterium]